jgi:hypothetical protein
MLGDGGGHRRLARATQVRGLHVRRLNIFSGNSRPVGRMPTARSLR